MELMIVLLALNVHSKRVTDIKVLVIGAGIRMKKDAQLAKNVPLVEYVQLGPSHFPRLNLINVHRDIIVLVALVKLLPATPMQNMMESTWTQIVRKILLNAKLVTNAQKGRVYSNHVQRVLSPTVHLWLHVTIVMLVTTVPPSTTQMDKAMTTAS